MYILYTEQNSFWLYLENENISDKVENEYMFHAKIKIPFE